MSSIVIAITTLCVGIFAYLFGVWIGIRVERDRWIAHNIGYIDRNVGGEDYVVMTRGFFWEKYHNPLVRARYGMTP